ncbi:unnamed protein product [Prorocentrum cordatum]|uniref:Carrier domain-containing protein n=1 Tax=Prorocentrum cordatum TaxID=2364126 RepID=A0ABN9VPB5_9DINO|nr:unnamed protein product [Polarella glacialis]
MGASALKPSRAGLRARIQIRSTVPFPPTGQTVRQKGMHFVPPCRVLLPLLCRAALQSPGKQAEDLREQHRWECTRELETHDAVSLGESRGTLAWTFSARLATDGLGERYTSLADDAAAAEKKREAAMLFSVAEGQLTEKEDYGEALKGAEQALELFKAAGDAVGVADSCRLMVHAYKARADASFWGADVAKAEEDLRAAEEFCRARLAGFEEAGERVCVGAMLLSLSEVIYLLPKDYRRREEAAQAATQAREIFHQADAAKLEGFAIVALFRIAVDRLESSRALALASEALQTFRALGEPGLEARAHGLLAEARQLCNCAPEAVREAQAAVRMFREVGPKKMEAAAQLLLAEICLVSEKFKEALPAAKEALQLFEDLGYGRGFQQAALAMLADIYTQLGESLKAVEVAKEGLARCQKDGDKRGQVLVGNGLILAYVGSDVYEEGDMAAALMVAESSLSLARELDDKAWESQVLHTILQLHVRAEDTSRAVDVFEEAKALLKDTGDDSELVTVLDTLAAMRELAGELEESVQLREEQRAVCQGMADRVREGIACLKVSETWSKAVPLSAESLDKALSAAREAQGLFLEAGDAAGEAAALVMIAEVCLAGGEGSKERQPSVALTAALQAQELFQQLGDRASEAGALQTMATAHLEMEKPAEAIAAAQGAAELAKRAEDRRGQVVANVFAAQMTLAAASLEVFAGQDQARTLRRHATRAVKSAKEALSTARKVEDRFLMGVATYCVGQTQVALGGFEDALKAADQAVDLFRAIQATRAEADAIGLVAEVHLASGNKAKAVDVAEKALALAQTIQDTNIEARALEIIQRVQGVPGGAEAHQADPDAEEAADTPALEAPKEEKKGMDPAHVHDIVMRETLGSLASDEEVSLDVPLMEAGMDSLSSVAFRNSLNQHLGMNLPASLMFDYPSQRSIIEHICEERADVCGRLASLAAVCLRAPLQDHARSLCAQLGAPGAPPHAPEPGRVTARFAAALLQAVVAAPGAAGTAELAQLLDARVSSRTLRGEFEDLQALVLGGLVLVLGGLQAWWPGAVCACLPARSLARPALPDPNAAPGSPRPARGAPAHGRHLHAALLGPGRGLSGGEAAPARRGAGRALAGLPAGARRLRRRALRGRRRPCRRARGAGGRRRRQRRRRLAALSAGVARARGRHAGRAVAGGARAGCARP